MRKNNEQTDNTKYIIITLKNDITKYYYKKKMQVQTSISEEMIVACEE